MDEDKNSAFVARQQEAIRTAENDLAVPRSLGEHLIPWLVTAMQCCLIYALLLMLAGFLPGGGGPLLPLWSIFLVFFGFYWLSESLKRFLIPYFGPRQHQLPCRLLLLLMLGCAVLLCLVFCVWLHFYEQEFSLFDPRWFQALNSAFGEVDRDLQMLVLVFLLCFLAWLSYQTTEERANAALLLSKGSPLMLLLTGISLGEGLLRSNADFWQAALLLPVFYWFGLAAQSLQKASARRRSHAGALVGGTWHQERIIFQVMSFFGLIVIIAACAILLIQSGFKVVVPRTNSFKPLLPTPHPTVIINGYPPVHQPSSSLSPTVLYQSEIIGSLVGICILGLFIGGMFSVSLRLWLKRRKKVRRKQLDRDERKSLWNWPLFLAQCKALILSLLALLKLRRRKLEVSEAGSADDIQVAPPEIRSIRELYQTFLRKATRQGYPRTRDETPYEFQHRLHQQEPLLEPELEMITEAYALVRYGGNIPPAGESARLKKAWDELDCKWSEAAPSAPGGQKKG